jgi:hypothetical protein
MNWDFVSSGPAAPYLTATAGVNMDYSVTSGTLLDITNSVNYYSLGSTVEDRIKLSYSQGFLFIPRTLLAFTVGGSASLGTLDKFGGSNAVSGWAMTASEGLPYDVSAKAFFGFPLWNHIELPVFNLFVLQSLNGGLFYNIATAFSGADDIGANIQHSAEIEFLINVRTLLDATIPIGIGLSFNLNKIADAPGDAASYAPALFFGVDVLSLFFNQSVSY